MPLIVDPSKTGFEKVLRDYQIEALKIVWKSSESGATSRDVYQYANKMLSGKSISRASIINFLNAMCDEGVLNYEEETCKGGMRRKYFPGLDEAGFKKYIAKSVVDSLLKDFPEQTMAALRESLGPRASEVGL
ncbi:MAG TPA: BlaI/MecI/CopY family transcriptional regulator [Patescibacteria group bacterium]|nr:BlaI/MecI/CopY family transcriptional regulator [Patescibacteria group bacterium]